MRRLIAFPCAGETLVGTLDDAAGRAAVRAAGRTAGGAAGSTGLLVVSGGNEVRAGAHRGMALLAARVAEHGFPVFRYDRRGVGDSGGENGGFLSAEADLAAAVAAFRDALPMVESIVGFGNCDGASTLALFGRAAGIVRVLLANPWVVEERDDLPPAAAIRAHYAERLRDPRTWWRLMAGGVDIGKTIRGLRKIADAPPQPALAKRVVAAMTDWGKDARVLLAERDATAIAFRAAAPHVTVETVATASHSFARVEDRAALLAAVMKVLAC